jgi:hypothetical protein
MSAFTSKADIHERDRHVRFGPIADICENDLHDKERPPRGGLSEIRSPVSGG